jgi:hypothetical protein
MTSLKGTESPVRASFQQEDTLDRFQKEQINKQYSNTYSNPPQNVYSPTFYPSNMHSRNLSNSPNKRGPQSQEMFLDNLKPEYGQSFPRDVKLDASPTEKQRQGMRFNFHSLQDIEPDSYPSDHYQYNNNMKDRNSMQQIKKSTYEDISYDSPSKNKGFDKRIETYSPGKSFNILSNQSMSQNEMQERSPYGRTISALLSGQESVSKGGYDGQTLSPKRQATLNRSDSLKKQMEGDVAGRHNFYGETDYRYANKLPEREPLQTDQIYGPKALKNLSCLKLY